MSRIAKTLPVSGKLYRHFAVVTVAITVCLAIFADGASRESITEEVVAVKTKKERDNIQGNVARRMRKSEVIEHRTRGRFSSDLDIMPMEYGNGGGGTFGPGRSGGNPMARRKMPPLQLPPGMRSRAVVVAMGGSEGAGDSDGNTAGMLVAVVPETDPLGQRRAPDEVTSEGLNRIFEASRLRSGGGGDEGGE